MTKQIKVIQVSSFLDAKSKLPELVENFKELGLFVLKGHSFTKEEHIELAKLMGDIFDWNVSSKAADDLIEQAFHIGGQSIEKDKDYNLTKDQYLLDWHIEQVYFVYSPLVGFWHMTKISCPPGHGNTRFVDSNELFNILDKDEQEFLSLSMVLWDKPANSEVGPFYTKAVDAHPVTGIPIIRIETDDGCYILPTLYSLNGKTPTPEEEEKFQKILLKIKAELRTNESIRYEQQWEEGDFLVVDLFRMYHAVMGGFGYQERIMSIVLANADIQRNISYNKKPEIDIS